MIWSSVFTHWIQVLSNELILSWTRSYLAITFLLIRLYLIARTVIQLWKYISSSWVKWLYWLVVAWPWIFKGRQLWTLKFGVYCKTFIFGSLIHNLIMARLWCLWFREYSIAFDIVPSKCEFNSLLISLEWGLNVIVEGRRSSSRCVDNWSLVASSHACGWSSA